MNRSLSHSASAFVAAGGALVLGLAIALPGPAERGGPGPGLTPLALAAERAATRPVALDLGAIQAEVRFDRDYLQRARARSGDVLAVARRVEERAASLERNPSAYQLASFATAVATDVADLTAMANAIDPLSAAEPAGTETRRKAGTAARHHRRNLVMPYFSFLSRG